MRNEMQPSQQQLNQSIEQVRGMMQQIKGAPNKQAMLAQLLQNNPNTRNIAALLQSNSNLEIMAKQMAQTYGIDINNLIRQLEGGF